MFAEGRFCGTEAASVLVVEEERVSSMAWVLTHITETEPTLPGGRKRWPCPAHAIQELNRRVLAA